MKRRSRVILAGVAGLLIAGGALWFFFGRTKEKAAGWKTARIEKGEMAVKVTATGSLSALTTVQVGTQVSGIVARLLADFNSEVSKGQVIALLDTSILSTSLDEARSLLERSGVQLNQAKAEYERQKGLFDSNVISKAEYDLAQANYQSALSSLNAARAQMNRARINRQYAVIRSPIKGKVISRNVDVGQTVIAALNSPVLYVIANDLRKMQVYANVDEADIGQVKTGQEVNFTVDAYPTEKFPGIVRQIRLQPVVVQNVVTYIVVIDVDNEDMKLLPGLTANISFKVMEHPNVLKVQAAALQFTPADDYLVSEGIPTAVVSDIRRFRGKARMSGDSAYLWIREDVRLKPEKIAIGILEGGFAEVSGNIRAGQEVVVRQQEDEKATTRNPFMPTMGHRRY